ncbi:MAG: Flp family type IVb pilin [Armatimonadota bacterium]|nr:Flp family type IVb pilin [Armatimonadota bacterium]
MLQELWTDETALTTVEYALLLLLVAVSGIVAWQALGRTTDSSVNDTNTSWPPRSAP